MNKDNITVNNDTGKEDVIKVNGKAYKYTRSEVSNENKLKYNNTTFNDIEAKVSPEGLHDKFGEIDYTKLSKKKVYLVEETSDGHYGKFVVANNITSDTEAVEAWKNGQDSAKDFTKENVTLEEGDSILVLDKDTYATTTTTNKKKKRKGTSFTYIGVNDTSEDATNDFSEITYTINRDSFLTIKDIGEDGIFGTSDDREVEAIPSAYDPSRNSTVFDLSGREDKYSKLLTKTPNLNVSTATVKDILKDIYATSYKTIDYLLSKAEEQSDIDKINAVKTHLDNKVNEILSYMKEKHISVGLSNEKVQFYVTDPTTDKDEEKLTDFENKVKESLDGVLYNLPVISKKEIGTATAEEARKHHIFNSDLKAVDKTITKSTGFTAEEGLFSKTSTNFFRDSGSDIDWGGWNTTNNNINLSDITSTNSWNITIGDNNNAVLNKTEHKRYIEDGEEAEEENEYSTTITKKEIMSPIRAYNVVSDGYATVNHYYTLKTEPEELKETVETKGKAIVKYIDADGNEIKADETIKPETVIKTVKKYETKSDITVVSNREEVENNDTPYDANTAKQDIIEKDGKKYKFSKVLETSDKYNNTTELTGNLKEGTTTVVYQYDYLIPVDPTKPKSPDTPDLPKTDDKIPNDPQNRSYKDLGLLKEVERNITYVYENGPKAGQEASTPVKQNARFTRTALINSRTGEVTYETEWTPSQSLPEIQSPTKDKYVVDKATVEALNVTHESENTNVVVKYSENPDVTEHDADKDKKGKVVVKHIDAQGNLLKEEVVKENVIVATATTKVYADRDPETTYTPVDVDYSTTDKKQDVIEKDGKQYKFSKVLEVTPEFNNTTSETGKVKEGTTTVVYQYDYLIPVDPTVPHDGSTTPPSPEDKIPNDPQNRSYKDLGLAKDVKRTIKYVYENGPKAGQEVDVPNIQTARFTRTALINSRTGEVTYTNDWAKSQTLEEVTSPVKEKYVSDKEKVDSLTVTNESEDVNVVVKYSENPTVIEYDATKDKKGKVVVKHIDSKGNLLKEDVVKEDVTVATATTKVYADRDPETTYTPVDVDYSTTDKKQDVIEKDGKKYKFTKVVEVTPELNNTTEETGKVKEGTTTIVYQYALLIPVDPSKPNEGKTTPPSQDDKIPNDPLNRTYKDLGLLREVIRTIKYVYKNGDKVGQKASDDVVQTVRFTRTASINSITGEVSYDTDWNPAQSLPNVVSPTIDNYKPETGQSGAITVTHESESSIWTEYYLTTTTTTVIEHDADKDKKGTVVVKYVDINGTVLKESVVKDKVTVATARTVIETGKDPVTTYTPTNEKYSVTKDDTITVDGLTFKLNRIVPVTPELNNSVEENGLVKEGTTTVIYEYKLIIPSNDIVNNVGEYDKPVGSVPNDAPVHEIPEFNGGVVPIDPPIVEIPEYTGGVVPIDPPVVDVPEYKEPIKDEPKVEKPKEEPKVETPKQDTTPKKALPKTSVVSNVVAGLSSLIGLAGLGLKNKKD